ncbi:MAG: toll/interleukin-1 receptor domain-containing protein [Thermoproteota archaeon]
MVSQQDLRLQVLQIIYSDQRNDPYGFVELAKIKKQVNIADYEIEGIVKYLEGKGLVKVKWFLGGLSAQITVNGIEEVERNRLAPNDALIKDVELREKMLRFLYDAYLKDPKKYVEKTDLLKTLNSGGNDIVWAKNYLRDKGLIEVEESIGGDFMARITSEGIDAVENAGVTRRTLLFISHSHKDKETASYIKSELRDFDIDAFVAHEDISPTEEWQKVILEKLKQCTGILLLLTEDFKNSDWTDQETGFALALNKIIIPIKITIDPYGFVSRYQALPWGDDKEENIYKLIELLVDKKIILGMRFYKGFCEECGIWSDSLSLVKGRLLCKKCVRVLSERGLV